MNYRVELHDGLVVARGRQSCGEKSCGKFALGKVLSYEI